MMMRPSVVAVAAIAPLAAAVAPPAIAQDIAPEVTPNVAPVTIDAQPEFSAQPDPNLQAAAELPTIEPSSDLAVLATQVSCSAVARLNHVFQRIADFVGLVTHIEVLQHLY